MGEAVEQFITTRYLLLSNYWKKDSSVSIHTRNLRFLALEMSKAVEGLTPTIVNDLFSLRETNNCNIKQILI